MSKVKIITLSILGIIGVITLAFVLELGGLQWKRFFAPKHEDVRREVFKATRSYNEGKIQQLAKYKFEYEKADDSGKMIIKSTIQHMFADFNCKEMPYGLKTFLTEMRGY